MSDELTSRACGNGRQNYVPIKVNKVFDSYSDRDCYTNLPVILDNGEELPCNVNVVKSRCVKVVDVCIDVDALPFNKGFYSVDITYTFRVEILAYEKACECPKVYKGTAYASKNCILFGSESNTKTFFSDGSRIGKSNECCETVNLPSANVQLVDPIVLESKVGIANFKNDCDDCGKCARTVILTLGLFSVVELTRPTTVMVATSRYTIPKSCAGCETESPCELFSKIDFPTDEFSPAMLEEPVRCECDD